MTLNDLEPQKYGFAILVFAVLTLRPALRPASCSLFISCCRLSQLFCIKPISSAKCKLLMSRPWIETESLLLSLSLSIRCSKFDIKISGDNGSPCFVPTVCINHSPMSWPIFTPAFDLSYSFWSTLSNFACTLYQLKTAQITLCFMVSNAFWKSTKQL